MKKNWLALYIQQVWSSPWNRGNLSLRFLIGPNGKCSWPSLETVALTKYPLDCGDCWRCSSESAYFCINVVRVCNCFLISWRVCSWLSVILDKAAIFSRIMGIWSCLSHVAQSWIIALIPNVMILLIGSGK